jgi:hypothetical protein
MAKIIKFYLVIWCVDLNVHRIIQLFLPDLIDSLYSWNILFLRQG